ncbi:hypothetical protein AB0454_28035, partial [Streptomyces sp. NPDC093509]
MSTLVERTETADGYRARRTLPLRVELLRQLKRRRTLVMGAILALLPFVLVAAFAIGGEPGGRNGQVTLMDTVEGTVAATVAGTTLVTALEGTAATVVAVEA